MDENLRANTFELWNKMDLIDEEGQMALVAIAKQQKNVFPISALHGHGLQEVCAMILLVCLFVCMFLFVLHLCVCENKMGFY